jgi:SAM-dependent methyltransferase
VRLYAVSWFRSLLQHLAAFLRAGGILAIPKQRVGSGATELITLDWFLESIRGRCVREDRAHYYLQPDPTYIDSAATGSLLDWYRRRALYYLYTFSAQSSASRNRGAGAECATACSHADPSSVAGARSACAANATYDLASLRIPVSRQASGRFAQGTVRRLVEHALTEGEAPYDQGFYRATYYRLENAGIYSAQKAAYVLAAIRHARRTVASGSPTWHHLDIGSGPGLVPMELLLSAPDEISTVTILEPYMSYVDLFADVFLFMRSRLTSGLFYVQEFVEQYAFPDRMNSISFCGSLLLVDRKVARAVLERAWNALEHGGVLVVFENVRPSGSPAQPSDLRFENEELERLLSGLAEIQRWHPTALRLCPLEEAASGPLFKSLIKRS